MELANGQSRPDVGLLMEELEHRAFGVRDFDVRGLAAGCRERHLDRCGKRLDIPRQICGHRSRVRSDHHRHTEMGLGLGESHRGDARAGDEGDRIHALPGLGNGSGRAVQSLARDTDRAADRPGRQSVGLLEDADVARPAPEMWLLKRWGGRTVQPRQRQVDAAADFVEQLPVLAIDAPALGYVLYVVRQVSGDHAARFVRRDFEHGPNGHLLLHHQ